VRRWWGIRHLRYWALSWWLHAQLEAQYGRCWGYVVSIEDALYLQKVWRGEA
jgi:hypothetical protein